ncbi:MAG: hypothetical protein COB46_09070 [Rhodospirillaceae bacterium]|nr:MAG: hypothetical protein COB46_09070 [Rhodospirillaceae bacterium]
MFRNYLPDVMGAEEHKVVDSLIKSLVYLKEEAQREGQAFIAYAIEDAIIHAKEARDSKYTPPRAHNTK